MRVLSNAGVSPTRTNSSGGSGLNNPVRSVRPVGEGFPIRVFIADDHAVFRDGVRSLITSQPDMVIVGEASDGAEALKALQTLSENSAEPSGLPSVDVLVMDVSMPNGNGIETTEKIKRQWPKLRVLALSMHEDRSYVRGMLQARVAGYVFKRSAADTLMGAIRLVASGQTYVDPALTPEGNSEPPNRTPLRGELYGARLSERESDALRLIAQGYTNKEIAAKMEISVKTVETYKSRATEKLGLDSRAAIVRYALQRGWLTPAG